MYSPKFEKNICHFLKKFLWIGNLLPFLEKQNANNKISLYRILYQQRQLEISISIWVFRFFSDFQKLEKKGNFFQKTENRGNLFYRNQKIRGTFFQNCKMGEQTFLPKSRKSGKVFSKIENAWDCVRNQRFQKLR